MNEPVNPHRDAQWKAIWDQAMTTARGLRLEFSSIKEAEAARFGLYRARNQERKLNAAISGESRSDWDVFSISIVPAGPDAAPGAKWALILRPYTDAESRALRIVEL